MDNIQRIHLNEAAEYLLEACVTSSIGLLSHISSQECRCDDIEPCYMCWSCVARRELDIIHNAINKAKGIK